MNRKLNLPILKSLLTGSTSKPRIAAAASLLVLGDNDGRQPILDALKSEDWGHALEQLERVGPGRCAFARKELKAIASDPAKADEIRVRARRLLVPTR
jgi:HEAT repeat protein